MADSTSSGEQADELTRYSAENQLFAMQFHSDLNDDTKIQQLKTKIVDLAKVDEPLEIRCGYPPKVLDALDDDTLKKCGISSGGEKTSSTACIYAIFFDRFDNDNISLRRAENLFFFSSRRRNLNCRYQTNVEGGERGDRKGEKTRRG